MINGDSHHLFAPQLELFRKVDDRAFLVAWTMAAAGVNFFTVRRKSPQKLWRLTGFSFGLVVVPASFGLYVLSAAGPLLGLLVLIVGLPLSLLHYRPGSELALLLGLIEPRTAVEGVEIVYIALLNSVVWSVVYGVIGFGIDWIILKRKKRAAPVSRGQESP